ncbi:MAG: pilus assembly protein PilP, partial [Desulfosarcina sp.]|nr:pilus assembly protein PilP [Desulfobacterales bacterium]
FLGFGLTVAGWGCKGDTKGKTEPVVTKKIASTSKAKSKAAPPVQKDSARKDAAKSPDAQKASKPAHMARLPYNPVGKLDPFKPLFKEEPKPKEEKLARPKKPERPRTPLEKLDLGQLKLTAIVFSKKRPRAMVEEATGKGYVVEIGTPIGIERGQVTDITRDRIVIEHLKTDDFGNTAPFRRELKLLKPSGD